MSQQTRPGSRPFCCARMQTEKATGAFTREPIWFIRDSNSPMCNITSFISQTNAKDTLGQRINLWFPMSYYSFSCALSLLEDTIMQLNHTPSFFSGSTLGLMGLLMKIVYVSPVPAHTWHWTFYHATARRICYQIPAKKREQYKPPNRFLSSWGASYL